MPKLTKRTVEVIQPDPDRDLVVWDSDLPGFGIRVWPTGKRVYILKYRTQDGRQRKATLGPHGRLTAEQARNQALKWLGDAQQGGDPAKAKTDARRSVTVARLCEQYIEEHAKPKKKPSSVKSDEALIRLHIVPRLGNIKVPSIERADISQLHHSMRATPGAANRTLALLSKMFNLAEKWGVRPDGSNPCRHVERYRERKFQRFLSNEELAQLGSALADAEHENVEMPSVIAALRLLLFTGCRLSEIQTLKWTEVDFENQCLRLEDSKTGAKTVYLPAPALEVLNGIERSGGNRYVIAGARPGSHLVNIRKPWHRIRKRAGLDDVRIHDLRHSFASVAAAGGLSLPMIGALLGHSQPATTQRYAHLLGDPMKQAAALTGGRIAGALAGQGHLSKVLESKPNGRKRR